MVLGYSRDLPAPSNHSITPAPDDWTDDCDTNVSQLASYGPIQDNKYGYENTCVKPQDEQQDISPSQGFIWYTQTGRIMLDKEISWIRGARSEHILSAKAHESIRNIADNQKLHVVMDGGEHGWLKSNKEFYDTNSLIINPLNWSDLFVYSLWPWFSHLTIPARPAFFTSRQCSSKDLRQCRQIDFFSTSDMSFILLSNIFRALSFRYS